MGGMSMVSVRFPREVVGEIRSLAFADKVSVSEWIRRTVRRELAELADIDVLAGSPGLGVARFRVPAKLLRDAAEADLRARAGRPRTFSCPHWAIGGVLSAECMSCGQT